MSALGAFPLAVSGRLGASTLAAELAVIAFVSALRAFPAIGRLGCAALAAELADVAFRAALRALPAACGLHLGCLGRLLLLSHCEQGRRIGSAACCLLCHTHAEESHRCAIGVLGCVHHSLRLCVDLHGACHACILEYSGLLQILDHLLVFFGCLETADAECGDDDTVLVSPSVRQHFIEGLGHIFCMIDNRAVADAHIGDLAERGLQSGQKLCAQLVLDAILGVVTVDVAADVLVEQDRITESIGILTEAADGDIDVQADIVVHNTEGNRIGRSILVADDILGVKIVNSLIMRCHAAIGETSLELLEALCDALAEAAGEYAGLCGGIIRICARLRADVNNRALVNDDHTLAFIDNDCGTICDDVVTSASVEKT